VKKQILINMSIVKAYLIAIPLGIFVCAKFADSHPTNLSVSTYDLHLHDRLIQQAAQSIFVKLQVGYGLCLLTLVVHALKAGVQRDTAAVRRAFVWLVLNVLSMLMLAGESLFGAAFN